MQKYESEFTRKQTVGGIVIAIALVLAVGMLGSFESQLTPEQTGAFSFISK